MARKKSSKTSSRKRKGSKRRTSRGRSSRRGSSRRRSSRRGSSRRRSRGRRANSAGCGPNEIEVRRSGYERSDGTRVKPTTYCATDQGRPGKTAYGAEGGPHSRGRGYQEWIQEEGSLGKGFLTTMSFEKQKKAMRKALREEKKQHQGDYVAAYRSALGKIMALNRSTELRREYRSKIDRIRDWFVKEYGADSKHWPKDRRSNPGDIGRLKNSLTALPPHLR